MESSSVVANGAMHGLLMHNVSGEKKIVSIDLENEEFRNICCLEVCIDVYGRDKTNLIELKGFLCWAH